MTGALVIQIVLVVGMLVMTGLANSLRKQSRQVSERHHYAVEQSIYLVGACLGCIIILGKAQ